MTTPIEFMLDAVQWKPSDNPPPADGGLYATHSGVLSIGGHSLRCYRLNDGQAVFDAADLEQFFTGLFGADDPQLP